MHGHQHADTPNRQQHSDRSAGTSEIDHPRHGADHRGHGAAFGRLFWTSTLLSIPAILYSEMVQEWLRFSMPEFPGSNLIAPLFGTIVFNIGGRIFIAGGLAEARARQPGMMALITLAIVVAFVTSLLTTLGMLDLEFWWELVLLIDIMLLGHWLEMRAIGQASSALDSLARLLPDEAERITGTGFETVPLNEIRTGDLLLVRPGGRVPIDGRIATGQAELDESMITGESRPVAKTEGDTVSAGTVALGSSLRIATEAVGENTALAGIQRLVAEAQQSRSRAQALADRVAAMLFYIATAAGFVTFIVWSLVGDIEEALVRTITVLVISCPHALGLAIPLVIAISTSLAANHGILVRDRLALERMRSISTVVFDKTGTLTTGQHQLTGIASIDGDDDGVLAFAAAVEQESEHPLARAIVRAASHRALPALQAHGFTADPGIGVNGTVSDQHILIGGPALLRQLDLAMPSSFVEVTREWESRGAAVLTIVREGTVAGALALEDAVRPESREAVAELRSRGVRTAMLTGDARAVADYIGASLGLDDILAEVLPDQKASRIASLQHKGERVAMVGDGVNDAPALATADVGIAIGAGTDVAIDSAGIILARDDPRAVVSIIRLSEAAWRKMIQNLVWAAGYNIIAIPLAAGVLAPVGFVLPPAMGAVMMSLSTVIVAINAIALRRLDLRSDPDVSSRGRSGHLPHPAGT